MLSKQNLEQLEKSVRKIVKEEIENVEAQVVSTREDVGAKILMSEIKVSNRVSEIEKDTKNIRLKVGKLGEKVEQIDGMKEKIDRIDENILEIKDDIQKAMEHFAEDYVEITKRLENLENN